MSSSWIRAISRKVAKDANEERMSHHRLRSRRFRRARSAHRSVTRIFEDQSWTLGTRSPATDVPANAAVGFSVIISDCVMVTL